MRTSLSEIKRIEQYLSGGMTLEERSVLEIEALKDERFRLHIFLQRKIYQLLKIHRRDSVRDQITSFHREVFNEPGKEQFKQRVLSLF
jgi:hypothetical protein